MAEKNKKAGTSKKKKINWIGIFSIAFILIFMFVYVLSNQPMWGERAQKTVKTNTSSGEGFQIEGKLSFLNAANEPYADFYIEIADEDYSRERGMMYRYFIPDTVGMLFIFPREDNRFFWMKNTPSSLDIIYADKDFKIVSIHENTSPYSLATIPSGDKAKYVIELKAGFAARHGIEKNHTFVYREFN